MEVSLVIKELTGFVVYLVAGAEEGEVIVHVEWPQLNASAKLAETME